MAASAIKKFIKLGDLNNIGTIEELDASGCTVTLLSIDSETLLHKNNFEYFKGKLLGDNYPIYLIPKGHLQTSIYGIVNGFQKYTSLDQLQLTPGATTAKTARQVTFLPGTLSMLTAATGGNYQIAYRKADGSSYLSASLAYNATTAAVNAAIVMMAIPNISVAASNGLNSTSGLTLTITNLSQDGSNLVVNSAQWSCIAGVYDASVALEVTTSNTQAGVTSTGFACRATMEVAHIMLMYLALLFVK